MSHYKLDVAKWRCGDTANPKSILGLGSSKMLNDQGYMCCLGQFAKQKGVPDSDLLGKYTPLRVAMDLDSVYDEAFSEKKKYDTIGRTALAAYLMSVNDHFNTTPKEKIQEIKVALEQHGHTLEVINEHLLEK